MNTTYPIYADVVRMEIGQRLRDAERARRHRLARNTRTVTARATAGRQRTLPWR